MDEKPPVTKQQWRTRFLEARRHRPVAERADAQRAVTETLLGTWLAGLTRAPAPVTVCAYLPLPSEPLAPDLPSLLGAAGVRVLVPVARRGEPLDWCVADGPTRHGMLGVAEPTGPRLGPEAIRDVTAVLVPALAVDGRGVRLGRGGGHYDRSLALLPDPHDGRRAPRLTAVVFDDEVVDRLPRGPLDVPVDEVVTPRGGLRHVASRRPDGASSN